MVMTKKDILVSFGKLLDIMDDLRAKCPWDKEQTFESLRNLTIEETYELADAVLKKDLEEIKNELGDLMLHIVFYAKIGSENQDFDIGDVIQSINKKLITRHPHIYGDIEVKNADDVKKNWEEIKLGEGKKSVLEGVPKSLPALVKANRIQEKVRGVGFDWEHKNDIWDKVEEEINEVKRELIIAYEKSNKNICQNGQIEAEFGDLFFTLINAARLYGIDPENALERTNQKFIKRFAFLEDKVSDMRRELKDMSLNEMDKIWEEAKEFD
jgi:XTP/dITP diphosphohydrolase